MMGATVRTIVITGGTDGMGAALAGHYLRSGERVVVVGRSAEKFRALVAAAGSEGGSSVPARAEFVQADLSLIADARRVVDHLTQRYERLDALVLAASFIRQRRQVTPEGHEASWVLFFVSKYLLVTGVAELLGAAERPVIANTAVPGAKADAIDFEDLELTHRFSFARSNAQQRRANDLLGLLATRDPRLSYFLWGPARLVRTSFAGEVGPVMKAATVLLAPLIGQDPSVAVRPLINLLDDPSPGRAAYRGGRPVAVTVEPGDERDLTRLATAIANS